MPVELPVVIKTIQEWIGKNKVQESSTSILEGTKAMRTKNFGEFLFAFVSDFISGALPGPLKTVLGDIGTNVTNALNAFGPLGTNVANSFNTVTKFLQNPVGSVMEGIEATSNSITAAANAAAGLPANVSISATLTGIANDAQNLIKSSATGLKSATNSLIGILPGDYDLQTVIKLAKSVDTTTANLLGLQSFALDDLAGMYIKKELHTELENAVLELNGAIAVVDPSIPSTVTDLTNAHARALAAAAAIDAEVLANQQAIAEAMAQDALLQAQYDIARVYDSMTDEEKAIFGETIQPDVLTAAQNINTYTNTPPTA